MIRRWFDGQYEPEGKPKLRSEVHQALPRTREIVTATGCMKTVTLSPPPAVGGLMIKNANPFDNLLESFCGRSLIPMVIDILDEATGVLKSAEYLERVALRGTESPSQNFDTIHAQAITRVTRICDRFHRVTRQLQDRHAARATLTVNDEYDVQDLLHALLLVDFDDVRPEEWTPSYASSSSRVDFLLKREKLVVEVKKTRDSLPLPKLADQLVVDIARYKQHPDCATLLCFVYDPEFRIGNPTAFESDLSGAQQRFDVRVLVRPRGD